MLYKMEIGRKPSLFIRLSQGADRVLDSSSLQKMVEKLVDSGSALKAYKLLINIADTYNTLISGMCKAGHVNGAFKLLKELQLKGHFTDAVTYATLIDRLQRINSEEDSIRLFEQMNENGCKHTASVFKTLMTWSCRRNKLSVAFGFWLRYLTNLADREDEAFKLVEKFSETGDYENAVRGLLEMDIKLRVFDSATYIIWLIGLCQAKRVEEAHTTFYVLEEFGITVSPPGCVKLIDALCREGKLKKAVEIFRYSTQKGYLLMPPICDNLIRALSLKGKSSLALEVTNKMTSAGYDLISYLHGPTKLLLHR